MDRHQSGALTALRAKASHPAREAPLAGVAASIEQVLANSARAAELGIARLADTMLDEVIRPILRSPNPEEEAEARFGLFSSLCQSMEGLRHLKRAANDRVPLRPSPELVRARIAELYGDEAATEVHFCWVTMMRALTRLSRCNPPPDIQMETLIFRLALYLVAVQDAEATKEARGLGFELLRETALAASQAVRSQSRPAPRGAFAEDAADAEMMQLAELDGLERGMEDDAS